MSASSGPRPFVSPFAADSARKGTPRMESSCEPAAVVRPLSSAINNTPVVMGSAAPAVAPQLQPQAKAVQEPGGSDAVRSAVLGALASAGLTMLVSMPETGEWNVTGNEVIVRVAASASLIDMSVSKEGQRIAVAAASGTLGRPIKLQIIPGASSQASPVKSSVAPSNGSSRGRAEQEPVVKRMREKFGAEIRTVIDYRQKP